jgi:dihydroneopterin aldolase
MEPSIPEPLVTARNYARFLQGGGEAHSIIRVQNLSTQALVGGSIWGVPSDDGHRNIFQPMLISSTLSLREPFGSAAQSDSVNDSTVNYSTLSKEILKAIASRRPDLPHSKEFQGLQRDWSLYDLVGWMHFWLTGYLPSGRRPATPLDSKLLSAVGPSLADKSNPTYKLALLNIESLFELGFTVFLPKATLLSSGVSLSTSSMYFPSNRYRSAMKIHGIRIPTLIGVNKKERLAKQLVIANVEVDPYVCQDRDYYNELEQIIVKVRDSQQKQVVTNYQQDYRRVLFCHS